MEKARPGERYILGGENLTLKQILDKLAAITGLPSPSIKAAIRSCVRDRRGRYVGHGQDAETRAAGDAGFGAHGTQEDVCHQRQGRARVGMESRPGGWSIAASRGVVPGARLCPIRALRWSWRCAGKWLRCCEEFKVSRKDGVEFFELENAVIAVGGIGRIAAWSAAEAVVKRYNPSILISAGIAGALKADLKVGDVVGEEKSWMLILVHDSRRAVANSVMVTVSSVSGPEDKRLLADRYKADVVDMECCRCRCSRARAWDRVFGD